MDSTHGHNVSESDLLAGVVTGQQPAFEQLYVRYAQRFFQYGRSRYPIDRLKGRTCRKADTGNNRTDGATGFIQATTATDNVDMTAG